MFFSSHCSQSSLEKLLDMPFSTTPFVLLAVNAFRILDGVEAHIEQNCRGDMDAGKTIRLHSLLAPDIPPSRHSAQSPSPSISYR